MKIPTAEDEIYRISRLIDKEFYDVGQMFVGDVAAYIYDQILELVKKTIDRENRICLGGLDENELGIESTTATPETSWHMEINLSQKSKKSCVKGKN